MPSIRRNGSENVQVVLGFSSFFLNLELSRLLANWKEARKNIDICMVKVVILHQSFMRTGVPMSTTRYPHFPRRYGFRMQYPATYIGNGEGYALYVEITGRLHALLSVVQKMLRTSEETLGKSPDFLWQRLGRSAVRFNSAVLLTSASIRNQLWPSPPWPCVLIEDLSVRLFGVAAMVHICTASDVDRRSLTLYTLLLQCNFPRKISVWRMVWSYLWIGEVVDLVRSVVYSFSTRSRMLNNLEHGGEPMLPFNDWANAAKASGQWGNDPRVLR